MREWVKDLLCCPECRAGLEFRLGAETVCPSCGRAFTEKNGITDFLTSSHPVTTKEREAISASDSHDPGYLDRIKANLERLDRGEPPEETPAIPCIAHADDTRKKTLAMLEKSPLKPGGVLVELGADHCWGSGIFIDAGCRVLAVDISDHMEMAPRSQSPDFYRVKADMNRLPVNDGCVEYVWASSCVHHSWDLERTFREARRVLKDAGTFFLCCEPMPSWPRFLLFKLLGNFGRKEREMGLNDTLTVRRKWLKAARGSGFNAELIFPEIPVAEIRSKLRGAHLPVFLAGIAASFRKRLQVSIHMKATKKLQP